MTEETRTGNGEGSLRAIWIKRAHRGPMDPVESARAEAGSGLVDNAEYRGRRQVTVISAEAWADACREVDAEVDPAARRANLMVEGLDLEETRGRVLRIGDLRLEIGGETKPCHRMEEAQAGLVRALVPAWRGGVWGGVLNDAEIRVGDAVAWEE